jgi:hypothetical protein
MTHITESRAIGNHAEMGGSAPAAPRASLTVTEILSAGVGRRASRKETAAAQSTWDSEGGAAEREGESASGGAEGLPQTPTRLGH